MNELDVALLAARAAGAVLHAARSRPITVDHKGAIDLVTEADRQAEHVIREVLARHTPDIAVVGEEGGGAAASAAWVVDPLDGTTNFVHGFPHWCVSVGLVVDGRTEVGVVYEVTRDTVFSARRGHGAFADDTRLAVTTRATLAESLVATGFPYDRHTRAGEYLRVVEAVMRRCQGIRRAGAAALDLAYVAAGRLDAFWEPSLQPWDVAAGVLLVEEAGGKVTDHRGGPLDLWKPVPLASNGLIHSQMIEALLRESDGNAVARP